MRRTLKLLTVTALVVTATTIDIVAPSPAIDAASVTPTAVATASSCSTVASPYPFGYKVDGDHDGFEDEAMPGTYLLPGSGGGTVSIAPNDGHKFNWTSTYPVDAVIVASSYGANIYRYNNSLGDNVLNAPLRAGKAPDIERVWFCHDGLMGLTATTGGVKSIKAARGVSLSDIPVSVLDVQDPAVLADAYDEIANAGAFKAGGPFKAGGAFKAGGPFKAGDLFRNAGPFKAGGAFKAGDLIRAVGAFKAGGPFKAGSVLQTPLSSLVLDVVDSAGAAVTWDRVLKGTIYEGWPLQSVTFADLAALVQEGVDTTGDGVPDFTNGLQLIVNASLFDLDSTGIMLGKLSVLSLLLMNTPLNVIGAASGTPLDWCELSKPYTGNECVIDDANGIVFADATLFELALYGVPSSIVPIWNIDLVALRNALLAPGAPKAPLALLLRGDRDGDGTVESTPQCIGDATLGQCIAELLTPTDFPWEDLPLQSLNLQQYALGERLPLNLTFSVATTASVTVTLPAGFVYDPASGSQLCQVTCTTVFPTVAGTAPQVITYGSAMFTTPGQVQLSLKVAPKGLLTGDPGQATKPAGNIAVTLQVGTASQTTNLAGPTVADPWPTDTVPATSPDTFYFGSLAQGGINNYDITLPPSQRNSSLSVRLTALTTALDGDLTLFAANPNPSLASAGAFKAGPVTGASDQPINDAGTGAGGAESLPPETLQDVPTTPTDKAFPLLRGVSASRDTSDEIQTISASNSDASTRYRVQVSSYGTTAGDYAMRVIASPNTTAACAVRTFGGTVGTPTSVATVANPTGLVVYNTRTTSPTLLGGSADAPGAPTLYNLARSSGAWLLPVTPLDTDSWTTSDAASKFDCTPVAANAAVQAIAVKVASLKGSTLPALATLVIVGGDDKLPFFRLADTTSVANERDNFDAIGTDNPIAAAQRNRYFLSDDPYGTLTPISWLDRTFNVPDLAIGRLVESDGEIASQISQYLTNNGRLTASSALVTGYDFLADGANAVANTLAGSGRATRTLIDAVGEPAATAWSADDVRNELALDPDIASVNSHFSQWELLSSKGDAGRLNDIFDTTELPLDILKGSILFSAGCHSGLAVPDAYASANAAYPLLSGRTTATSNDWAQAFAARNAAVWIGSSGYAYGAVADVGLTERLLAIYARNLVDPASGGAGDALLKAKQEYFAGQGVYGSYDEKALQQVVFYGIPTFKLDASAASGSLNAAAFSAPAVNGLTPTDGTGGMPASAPKANVTFNPVARPTADGRTAYTVDGETLVINGYPVTPKTSFDVTSTRPGYFARGAAIETMDTELVDGVVPEIARATVDRSTTEPASQPDTMVFPTSFQSVAGSGDQQRLVVLPGQFNDFNPAPGADAGSALLLRKATFTVYYATTATAGDGTRPFIQESTASPAAGVVLFRVKATDQRSVKDTRAPTGVQRVLVQYDETPSAIGSTHRWRAIELQQDSSGDWVGGITTPNTDGRYFVQAFDGAGNQSISQFKGNFYRANGVSPKAVAVVTEGTQSVTGWYKSGVKVGLYIAGVPATAADNYTYRFNGSLTDITPYTVPFDVPEGLTSITFDPPAASNTVAPPPLVIEKDTVAPTTDLQPKIEVVAAGTALSPIACTAADLDPPLGGLASGVSGCDVLDPTIVNVGGFPYSLANVSATDVAQNTSAIESQTAVIVSGTRSGPNTFDGANAITIVVGGPLAPAAKVFINDAEATPDSGTPANVKSVTIDVPGTKAVRVEVPNPAGGAPITIAFGVVVSDTIPPTVTVPSAITVEATGPGAAGRGAATVDFTATGNDNTDGPLIPACLPLSGSAFPLGTTSVTCTVRDAAGNGNAASFDVVVVDKTAPTLVVSADLVVEATGSSGAEVSFTSSATDIADSTVVAVCTPASGASFSLGTTLVTCTATDASGNSSAKSFNVTVRDTTAPVLGAVPLVPIIEGNTIGGANVAFEAPTALDAVQGPTAVQCAPSSGSLFPVGTTTVRCTTSDTTGNSSATSFPITVRDTTAPTLTVPANIQVTATTKTGAVVTYSTSAFDAVKGIVPVTCSPASGTAFVFGATTVTCSATDGVNSASKSFKVTVVVGYRYYGFKSPVNMGLYDSYGLNYWVNTVAAGRNVPFKWEVYMNSSDVELKDVTKVELQVMSYKLFRTTFPQMTAKLALPNINVCADGTRTLKPISTTSTTAGKTTTIKLVGDMFNVGWQMPAKPALAADNCFVAWTRVIGEVDPGIVALFQLS